MAPGTPAVCSTGTPGEYSATSDGTTLTWYATAQINEAADGQTYLWAARTLAADGSTLNTVYYDDHMVAGVKGQTANLEMVGTIPEPGPGSKVVIRVLRFDADTKVYARNDDWAASPICMFAQMILYAQ